MLAKCKIYKSNKVHKKSNSTNIAFTIYSVDKVIKSVRDYVLSDLSDKSLTSGFNILMCVVENVQNYS